MSAKKQLFLLALVSFAVYFNSLPNDFIFDDIPLVQNSLGVTTMSFAELLTSYRPLRYISYAIDYRLFGMSPAGFRLASIFWHALTVMAVFWMLMKFGLSRRASFVAALVYAVHPVNTDAVAYISGRRDELMGLFYVLSIGFFFDFYRSISPSEVKESKAKKKWFSLVLSLVFIAFSVSSKEMGATIPLIFILYAALKDGAALLKKPWFYFTAMIFLVLFSFFAFLAISGGGSALVSLDGISFHGNSPEVHYLTAATIFLHYIKLTFFPLKLILDNAGYPLVLDWNFEVFFSILSMFVLVLIVWRLLTTSGKDRQKLTPEKVLMDKSIAFWIIFFVVSLAPVLQIIPLHEIVAVHYLYVPVIGFCAIAGILLDYFVGEDKVDLNKMFDFKGSGKKAAATLCVFLIFSLFSVRTVTRNFELKNNWIALHADEKWQPLSFRGLFTIGAEYLYMKFPDKAWEYYRKSIDTGYVDPNQLGNIIGYYIVKGDHASAFAFYEEKIREGEYITVTGTLNMAYLYMIHGDCEMAQQILRGRRPDSYQVKRFDFIAKCDTYGLDKFDESDMESLYEKQKKMKDLDLNVERKPYLKTLIESGAFEGDRLIGLVSDLAAVDLISDIPEAIKYYRYEIELYQKNGKEVPAIAVQSLAVLEDYQHQVIDEGKYMQLDF